MMKLKKSGAILSTIAMVLLITGCVKPTDEPNTTGSGDTVIYTDQPATVVYEDGDPIIYEDPGTVSNSGTTYGTDTTVVTTDHYEPVDGSNGGASDGGLYGDPYTGGGSSSSGGGEIYSDPYAGGDTTTPSPTYTEESSYGGGNSNAGGIHLQVAALKEYYSAVEFKNNLSLDPKYSAYVKKGAMNKVIVTGIPNRAEAKRLADRQFPGAFIVGGSATSSSYTSGSSYNSTPTSSSNTNSGIGIQIGAFSSQSKARDVAQNAAGSRYSAVVKPVKVRGKTLYKAIVVGFASTQEAKNAIASGQFGNGFVITNIY